MLDIAEMWATFNIRESDMEQISLGSRLSGYVPALARNLDFEVYYISAEADFATWSATRARGGFDIRTFEVRAKPIESESRLLPGMSVVVNNARL